MQSICALSRRYQQAVKVGHLPVAGTSRGLLPPSGLGEGPAPGMVVPGTAGSCADGHSPLGEPYGARHQMPGKGFLLFEAVNWGDLS